MAYVSAHSTQLDFELLQLHSGVQRVAKLCHSGGWQTIEHRYHAGFPLSVIVTLVLPRNSCGRRARREFIRKRTESLLAPLLVYYSFTKVPPYTLGAPTYAGLEIGVVPP